MKKYFILFFIYFFTISTSIANNIATVDIKLIMNSSIAGKDLKEKIIFIEKKKIELINKAKGDIKDKEKKKIKYNQKLLVSIQQILGSYSKSNNITLLLQKKNIVMGSNDIDITNDILKILNKNIKKID